MSALIPAVARAHCVLNQWDAAAQNSVNTQIRTRSSAAGKQDTDEGDKGEQSLLMWAVSEGLFPIELNSAIFLHHCGQRAVRQKNGNIIFISL